MGFFGENGVGRKFFDTLKTFMLPQKLLFFVG